MRLAKNFVDIGLTTNTLHPMLDFWQQEAGVAFDHVLPIREGHDQHRHDIGGTVLKINHVTAPLPETPPTGYRELIIARDGLTATKSLSDPDGNLVSLAPTGQDGITQIGIRIAVRDLDDHRRFYADALGFPEERPGAFRVGESLMLLEQSPSAPDDADAQGKGWRYITFQIFKVDQEHEKVLRHGGREAMAPLTMGTTARFSMVRDPDGNWIELSQRASIVGSLDPD